MSAINPTAAGSPIQAELARIELDALRLGEVTPAQEPTGGAGFADNMSQMLRQIDDRDQAAAERMAAVERGESDDLVGAMLASQEASLSFSMLMQVRNKVAGAVDELIKLQL